MKKLLGIKWCELSVDEKFNLLINAHVWSDIKEGVCIFDLTEDYSVNGEIKISPTGDIEYLIKDEAKIYNPWKGIFD